VRRTIIFFPYYQNYSQISEKQNSSNYKVNGKFYVKVSFAKLNLARKKLRNCKN